MLSFDLRSLESKAVQVDGALAPDDAVWQEGDPLPAEPVRVSGRLSTAGPGRFYFSGRIEGTASGECRRCLTDVQASVAEDVHLIFADEGDETVDDDPDVYVIDGRSHALDIRPAIREHWLLSVPGFVQCQEDCKGLCPSCGVNHNTTACDCAPVAADNRWDALRKARSEN